MARERVPVNRHHMWWERNWYHQKKDARLRQLGGFIVPTTVYTHQLLHAQMHPPVKPFSTLRDDIIDYTVSLEPEQERFGIPNKVADWLVDQHDNHHSDEYAYRAFRLAAHIRQQIGYMSMDHIK